MRITSKGQVTIPIEVHERAGLLPDTEVEFSVKGGVVTLRKVGKTARRGKRLTAALRGQATKPLSTDQIMALTRGE